MLKNCTKLVPYFSPEQPAHYSLSIAPFTLAFFFFFNQKVLIFFSNFSMKIYVMVTNDVLLIICVFIEK